MMAHPQLRGVLSAAAGHDRGEDYKGKAGEVAHPVYVLVKAVGLDLCRGEESEPNGRDHHDQRGEEGSPVQVGHHVVIVGEARVQEQIEGEHDDR